MDTSIALELLVESEVLLVTAVNRGKKDLKLWSRDNSWGWGMFSLLLAPPDLKSWLELTAKPVRWTRNVPRALELPAGGALKYDLRHADPSWEGSSEVGWVGQLLQVRVRLRIPETPEANEQAVFIGEALSPARLSKPPHCWLS